MQNYANTDGGGIDNVGNTFLYNTSVIDNDTDRDRDVNGGNGGGVKILTTKRFVVVNSLIARNTIGNTPIYDDCHSTLEGYGWNLLGDLSGCTFAGNSDASRGIIALNMFGYLQDNGGPTLTHTLLASSVAIDSTTAQRGMARPAGLACDVGAFEYHPTIYLYLPLILR